MGETICAKALDTTALMVDTNQGVASHAFDVCAQGAELLAIHPIAAKQNHAAAQGMR
jgi:hypothetical protein